MTELNGWLRNGIPGILLAKLKLTIHGKMKPALSGQKLKSFIQTVSTCHKYPMDFLLEYLVHLQVFVLQ